MTELYGMRTAKTSGDGKCCLAVPCSALQNACENVHDLITQAFSGFELHNATQYHSGQVASLTVVFMHVF
ncbi:hypothetical protein E2P81_ATG04778 [Venturia nashicola]|nr:hypothetical protein E2P81_ATG04778 [Venturia nashicola]